MHYSRDLFPFLFPMHFEAVSFNQFNLWLEPLLLLRLDMRASLLHDKLALDKL